MPHYSLLVLPSANRVYAGDAPRLLAAELKAVDSLRLGGRITASEVVARGGADYVDVETAEPLRPADLSVWSDLSSLYALFERNGDGSLRPLDVAPRRVFADDIVTTQRYPGKTNEALTKMLLNLALAASRTARTRLADGDPVRVLDPLCGRGTTLNHALAYGCDAWGVESEERDVDAYDTFITTYLKDHRVKHKAERATMRRGREAPAHRLRVEIRPDEGPEMLVDVVHDDTRNAAGHFPKATADLLVTDLPYGVQHGARVAGRGGSSAGRPGRVRRPGDLVEEAAPVWASLLRKGAGMAVSFNTKTLPRADLEESLGRAGFDVLDDLGLLHRVDRTIARDVVVATRS